MTNVFLNYPTPYLTISSAPAPSPISIRKRSGCSDSLRSMGYEEDHAAYRDDVESAGRETLAQT